MQPVSVETILVPDPGPGEAVVKVQACGVCHTDLHYREGGINDDFPFLLGHEAAGVVEAVGEGVTEVAPGDFVILNWRAVCGAVPGLPARPPVVLLRHPQRHPEDDAGGRHRALARRWASARSPRRRWSRAGQCTKVDPAARPAAAGLLGCGVMAGLGAAINTGGVSRGDRSPSSAAAASATRRSPAAGWPAPRTIIAVDIDDRKLEWAQGARRHPHGQLPDDRRGRGRSRSSPAATARTW